MKSIKSKTNVIQKFKKENSKKFAAFDYFDKTLIVLSATSRE